MDAHQVTEKNTPNLDQVSCLILSGSPANISIPSHSNQTVFRTLVNYRASCHGKKHSYFRYVLWSSNHELRHGPSALTVQYHPEYVWIEPILTSLRTQAPLKLATSGLATINTLRLFTAFLRSREWLGKNPTSF